MNRLENWFCASTFWRGITQKQLLPWLLAGTELGQHVLEIGAGAGAATEELRKRAACVTSLEYSRALVAKLVEYERGVERAGGSGRSVDDGPRANSAIVHGDATTLPFPENTFSTAIAILMLHHLRSREAQGSALGEAFRVLRPSGAFLAIEIENSWLNRLIHIRSTFVPVAPEGVAERLGGAGFSDVTVAFRSGAFRIKAQARK